MYVVIAGGGLMGGTLASRLLAHGHDVVVIEQEKSVCEEVASRSGAVAVHGAATDIEILEEAGLNKADVAVATLPYDAGNLAFALLAREFEVPRVVARMRSPRYKRAYELAGVTRTVNVGELFVRDIVFEIEEPTVRQVATFGGGKGCIVAVVVPEGARVDGQTVMEIARDREFPAECVITGIFREEADEFIIPRGGIGVKTGDHLFLAASLEDARRAAALLLKKGKVRGGRGAGE